MVTNLHATLWDAVKGHEAEVASKIEAAIAHAFAQLGDAASELDWHNIAAYAETDGEKAAA